MSPSKLEDSWYCPNEIRALPDSSFVILSVLRGPLLFTFHRQTDPIPQSSHFNVYASSNPKPTATMSSGIAIAASRT
jgi:hypothetical protein